MHKFDEMTEPELQAHMNVVGSLVKQLLPPDTGFIVLCSPMGGAGIAQYVANVHPSCSAEWMQETIERWSKDDYVQR